jgi:Protein of unknown function (DUF1822)
MNTTYSNSIENVPFGIPSDDFVEIPEDNIEDAIRLSTPIADPKIRWQSYLTLLALAGFTEWIDQNRENTGLELTYDRRSSKLLLPTHPDQPAAIAHLKLNQHFRVCLIATVGTVDEDIELPQAIIDQPKQAAHFYVNVLVDTESNVASIRGFLRYDQLQTYRQRYPTSPINGTYRIPLTQFESRTDRLLLLAHSLNPRAIEIPENAFSPSLEPIQQLILKPMINVADWLIQQFHDPTFQPAFRGAEFRSIEQSESEPLQNTENNISEMLQSIKQQGYVIPIDIRASYQELDLEGQSLRLTIVSWAIPSADTPEPEWSLLLIAQSPSSPDTPIEVKIKDADSILTSTSISPNTYHILQAIGFLHEEFTIVITQANTELILPPFQFEASAVDWFA